MTLPKHLPSIFVQSRWHSEPVHILMIDAAVFIKNQKGYPVLPKSHQALIARHMRLRTPPWIILCNVGPLPGFDSFEPGDKTPLDSSHTEFPNLSQAAASTSKKHHDPTPHLSYIRNLQQRQPPRNAIERFGTGYQDYLQAPLQPLTVNLESITYEVFEKDPIKYEWYERAISKALSDWVEEKKPTSNPDGKVVVAVVGAGRGPLVTRALRASAQTGVDIDLWAVEKNPNAFVLLQRHNQTTWNGKVTLVQSDMRSWGGPQRHGSSSPQAGEPVGHTLGIEDSLLYPEQDADKPAGLVPSSAPKRTSMTASATAHVDILISELLGSFGDNELSPECLDGVTHLLNPVHGISIPASYTAHLTPISAPRLHADVMAQSVSNPAAPETPYVVMLHAIDYLSSSQKSSSSTDSAMSSSRSCIAGATSTAIGNGGKHGSQSRSSTSSPSPSPLHFPEVPSPFVQTAWSFSHPNIDAPPPSVSQPNISNAHNVRQARLVFPCQNRGVCNGLAGYFETVLYRDVELSTNPVTMDAKSASMISWFPIYFPLKVSAALPFSRVVAGAVKAIYVLDFHFIRY